MHGVMSGGGSEEKGDAYELPFVKWSNDCYRPEADLPRTEVLAFKVIAQSTMLLCNFAINNTL